MKKFCIFCGNKPDSKSKEHIIPKWLLKFTGDPNREVYLGRNWLDPKLSKRVFRWSSYTFPACTSCNTEFSQLEEAAKKVVENLVELKPLTPSQFEILLDWLDKVRIGLWFAMLYLNKNYRGLVPQFHIKKRIGAKDRALLILRINDDEQGIGVTAADTPIFHKMPSILGLTINNIHLISISYEFIISERLGLPYVKKKFIPSKVDGFTGELVEGHKKISLPIIPHKIEEDHFSIYQSIIPIELYENEDTLNVYNNDYTQSFFKSKREQKSFLFNIEGLNVNKFDSNNTIAWAPDRSYNRVKVMAELGLNLGELQDHVYQKHPSMEDLSAKRKNELIEEIDGVREVHSAVLNHLKRKL